ncbi:MAG: TonB-dependent receptor, partial [Acidobacteriota bacterium]
VATDGFRIGSISALAGNEGEPLDLYSLDRIEVVRGPSTLLYGSNAIGGVVNAISRHADDIGSGVRGYGTVLGGTNNKQFVGSGGLEYGFGHWGVWGNGTLQRTDDYRGGGNFGPVDNTGTRAGNVDGGFGYFGPKGFFTANYDYYRNHYGIPVDPADPEERTANIAAHRHNFRFNGGFRDSGSFIEGGKFTFDYGKYFHSESEVFDNDPTTRRESDFFNDVYSYRATFEQRRHGHLSGTFGFDGYHRKFMVDSEEALIQGAVTQTQSSVYALEQINLGRVTLQFGGRVENSRYRPTDPELIKRDLTGFSGAFGARVGLWENGAFTANYSHSTRLPDLEEFYNNGPHDDTVSFEIGDPHLRKEVSDSIDLSVRHQAKRVRADGNFFYYWVKNFVYLNPTGEFDKDTDLEIADFVQADARFYGAEGNVDFDANRYLGVFGGFDYVRARFTSGIDLPRIPPLRGRLGVDAHFHGAAIRPELILAHVQNRVFTDESPTDGYAVFNIIGSYSWLSHHVSHTISANAFNLTDKLYFNHVSYVKDYTPEIGRGVRFSYTIRIL